MNKTIERETSHPIRFAGSEICIDCHDEANVKSAGYHRNLSCETCHGPAKEYSDNPAEFKPQVPKRREQCSHCHNPHNPKPPRVPYECEACHAEIARTKAVSPHVQLECTICHTTPREHKISPRTVKATIQARIFGDINSSASPLTRFKRMSKVHVLKPFHNTEPKVLYSDLDGEVR
jgi:hypothetical protein